MKSRIARSLVAAFLASAAFAAPASAEVEWLMGDGQSCDKVCKDGGGAALRSGFYSPKGKDTSDGFYVCAADKDGWRAGYNLEPNWSKVCMVGFGGKEVAMKEYVCACE